MIEIRFRDIDPDTGEVSQDKKICLCEDESAANLVIRGLDLLLAEESDPNREIYTIKRTDFWIRELNVK